eukprot:TRINITY_DN85_c0_g1_i1.p1 TRINITY_DN85_c0_g1~~TRINITY_DN85_c0_g1_i1.p1  ORF type:complete len:384 (-),score=99.42 TRINITY_DN85_c0_g1_i1:150-1268(-)
MLRSVFRFGTQVAGPAGTRGGATSAGLMRLSAIEQQKRHRSDYQEAEFKRKVTLIPGDGIGPEIAQSVLGVFQAAEVPIEFERFKGDSIDHTLVSSISRNQVVLKGPFLTSVGGKRSRNALLREALEMHVQVVPIKSIPGINTRHDPVDFVVVRENTEGEYVGIEQEVVPGVVQSLKVVTRAASERTARYAFEYARANKRKNVACIHKANIMKMSDGCFLEACRDVAKEYPDIGFRDVIVDNTCMQLTMNPQQFDVLVTPNLYGSIVGNVGTALVGGPGLVAGANFGEHGHAFFEPGARHVGMDIAGKNVANPTAMLKSSIMMLKHMKLEFYAAKIDAALTEVLSSGAVRTRDIGGTASTKEFTKAVIDALG